MPQDLSARLADACEKLRRTPMPIADLIPMIQASKDALEAQAAEIARLQVVVAGLRALLRQTGEAIDAAREST